MRESPSLLDWLDFAATLLSGFVIAFALAYFQSDFLRQRVNRLAVRVAVFSRDYRLQCRYLPPLLVTAGIVWWLFGDLTAVLAGGAASGTAGAAVSYRGRRRRPSLRSFTADDDQADDISLVVYGDDGSTTRADFCHRSTVRVRAEDDVNYIYFCVSRSASRYLRAASSVVFIVEFGSLDEVREPSGLPFWLNYDRERTAPYKRVYCRGLIGGSPWHMALFQVDAVDFRRRQQELADFRVAAFDADLFVRTVHLAALTR